MKILRNNFHLNDQTGFEIEGLILGEIYKSLQKDSFGKVYSQISAN